MVLVPIDSGQAQRQIERDEDFFVVVFEGGGKLRSYI
jgi:hypothetical protein